MGSPALFDALLEKSELMAFEPSASAARALLSLKDYSAAIESGRLGIVAPWDLHDGFEKPLAPFFMAHPASQRREPALCQRFFLCLHRNARVRPEKPRILIIPPFSGGSLSMGPFLLKAAKSLGLEAELMAFGEEALKAEEALKKLPQDSKDAGRAAKALFDLTLLETMARMEIAKPDLILALAQAPLGLGSLIELKDRFPECLIAYWFLEDYLRFSYARDIAPACDLFFHIQGPLLDAAVRDWGLDEAHYLPAAADADFFGPREVPEKYRAKISFMGAGYPNRLKIFGNLLENQGKTAVREKGGLKIFGSGWEKAPEAVRKRLFEGGRRVSAEETALIYAGAWVNLNIHSGGGPGFSPESYFVNPRTFEIAASGGFQITDQRPLLGALFSCDELAVARSPEELPDLIGYWLENKELREEAGIRARKRAKAEHLYTHRLEMILRLAYPKGSR
jgi:spore maturation protein CgeB